MDDSISLFEVSLYHLWRGFSADPKESLPGRLMRGPKS